MVYIGAYICRSIRWHFLLAGVKNIPAKQLFPHLVIGFFINNIFPMRIGEFARAYTSGAKLGISKVSSFGSIVLERTFDGLTFITFLLICFRFLPFPLWVKQSGLVASIFFLLMFCILIVMAFYEEKAVFIFSKIPFPAKLKNTVNTMLQNFFEGLHALRSVKNVLLILFFTICIWGVELSCFYLMSRAFNLNITFMHVLFTAMCIVLGVMVPAAPGYIGTYEFAGRTALEVAGVDPNIGISFILFMHVFQFIIISILGIPALISQQISLKDIAGKRT